MAQALRPEPSTTAKVVKGLDWATFSLFSTGLVLQSASLMANNGRPGLEDPLFSAFVVSFVSGVLVGCASNIVKGVSKLTSPTADVPGPFDVVFASSRAGRVLQTTGIIVAMVGLVGHTIGSVVTSLRGPGSGTPQAGTVLQIGGGLTAAVGMMGAMIGGELHEAPTVALMPVSGGAVVGLGASW